MTLAGVPRLLLILVALWSFAPGDCQFPMPPQMNRTLETFLNSTEAQKYLLQIYQALMRNSSSIASIFQRQNMVRMHLGQCGKDIENIRKNTTQLIEYIDAAGKPSSGLFQGNLMWSGSVDGCNKIPNSHFCSSQFTLSIPSFKFVLPFMFWSGCFPKSCTEKDVSVILKSIDAQVPKLTGRMLYTENHGPKCPEKAPYTTGAIVTIVFCGVLLLLCLIGTVLDLIIEAYDSASPGGTDELTAGTNGVELTGVSTHRGLTRNHNTESTTQLTPEPVILQRPNILNSFCCHFFLCFSVIRNSKKIFSTKIPPTAITSINGIRVISISWVVLGHTFLVFFFSQYTDNKFKMLEDAKLFSMMAIINATYSVDSFFFLSGLLVAYTCFRKMGKSNGKFNWALFYVHRFWRLTPSYMFVILFSVHLKGLLSDAPFWYTQYKDLLCSKYWWTNLLYVNNFHPEEFTHECIGWSWYLANDMQFFVITPLLLILSYKYGWRGVIGTAGSLFLISSITIAAIYGHYDLDPVGSLKFHKIADPEFGEKQNHYQNYIYSKPYCRIQPYLVGFVLGYFIYKKYSGPKRRGWIMAIIGWTVAVGLGMTLVYVPRDSTRPGGREWSKTENIFFGTFQRFLWGVALAWVTYACHYGYGSLIQKFLSSKMWIPFSRLSYSVYLVHLIVLTYMVTAAKGTFYYSLATVSYYFLAAMALSYGAGFILAVAIEFPCENLENLVLKSLQSFSITKKYTVSS